MNENALFFLLGVVTLPAVFTLLFTLSFLLGPRQIRTAACDHCRTVGLKSVERTYTMNLSYFLGHWRHNLRARINPAHRAAWQAYFDSLSPRSTLRRQLAKYQHKFGA